MIGWTFITPLLSFWFLRFAEGKGGGGGEGPACLGYFPETTIRISCIKSHTDEHFKHFSFAYEEAMKIKTNEDKFHFSDKQKLEIESMINMAEPNIIIDVQNYESDLNYVNLQFLMARNELRSNPGTYCVVTYDTIADVKPVDERRLLMAKRYHCATKVHVPRVICLVVAFTRRVRDMKYNKVKALNTIILVGHGVGGHVIGAVGTQLQLIYTKEKIGAAWAFDLPKYGFSEKDNQWLRKGVAEVVVIFHISRFCVDVDDADADFNIIVNGGVVQPGCVDSISGLDGCSRIFGIYLQWYITTTILPPEHQNSSLSGMERLNGKPIVYRNSVAKKDLQLFQAGECEKFPISFTHPPKATAGVYYMQTSSHHVMQEILDLVRHAKPSEEHYLTFPVSM